MSQTQMVGARVPLEIVKEMDEAVQKGYYLTNAQLVREAIVKELTRLKAVQ